MSKSHYPECWATYPSDPPAWCICDELRSCEERMLEAAVQRIEALLFPWPNTWPGMIRRDDVITAIRGEL
jgi:hypothetical protein